MRRDLGNEIMVAIAAVGVIVAAVVFGILLILPNNRALAPTETPVPVTPLVLVGSATPTEWPTTTSAAPTRTPTERIIAPSETPTRRTPSATPDASPTQDARVTPGPTRRTPSATPTDTVTPTQTPSPTRTPSMTRTPTRTASLTHTVTARPSPTFEAFPNVTPLALCAIPQGWQVYIVKSGDTLSKIAQRAGSTVEALSAANCLVDVNRIVTGDVLYVPGVGSPIGTPAGLSTEVALAYYGCAFSEIATITNVSPGQTLRGKVTLEGTANLPNNFWFYRLEIRPDFSNTFIELERVYRPVIADSLGTIDTTAYSSGLYWVRLMVVDSDWRYPPSNTCMIPVYFAPPLP